MDPEYNLQDVARCEICDNTVPSLHCDICDSHLCKACEDKHLSDASTEHKVVPFQFRGCTIYCQKHIYKLCEHYCEQCNIPICVLCVSSWKHRGHQVIKVVDKLKSRKEVLQRDLKELEKQLFPKYQEIASNIKDQKTNLIKNSQTLITAINKQRDKLHRKIDTAIKKLISDLLEIHHINKAVLNKQEDEIKRSISEIAESITDVHKLLMSNDVSLVSDYKSRNAGFKTLSPKHIVSLPKYNRPRISKNQIIQQVGSLTVSSPKTDILGYSIVSSSTESSLPEKLFIDEPKIIANVDTKYLGLHCVSCLGDEQIWTCYFIKNIMRLYNLQGELVKTIQTKSGNTPWDMDVTRSGDLVYTDYSNKTVNIVKNTKIKELIKLQRWRPFNICSTSSGDLLIVVVSDEDKQTKVVRYYDSTEKQSIQYDDKGHPLFSFGNYSKYISENRNLDICVADRGACKIVVVTQAGMLRFTYTGHPCHKKGPFYPTGITTDSRSQILTADSYNHRIHIIDKDGKFLRFIDNCDLRCPQGLSINTKDNLFVVELQTGKVKKIQY